MRLIAFVAAAFVASSPVAAEEWQQFAYPDYAFTVAFPAAPRVETTTYQLAEGRTVPAHVYAVRDNDGVFTVTVAETRNAGLDENAVIDNAIKRLSAADSSASSVPTAAARRSRCSITTGGFTRSKAGCRQTAARSTCCASSNRWCSPTAARTAPPRRSAPFARAAAAWPMSSTPGAIPPSPRARTIHAARSGPGSEAAIGNVLYLLTTEELAG
jgi:hypothetical protein